MSGLAGDDRSTLAVPARTSMACTASDGVAARLAAEHVDRVPDRRGGGIADAHGKVCNHPERHAVVGREHVRSGQRCRRNHPRDTSSRRSSTAARSARGCGRCATIVAEPDGTSDCTASTTCCAPPPNKSTLPPIIAPAASCVGSASVPAGANPPVDGSSRKTPLDDACVGSIPPRTKIPEPSAIAVARDTGDGSSHAVCVTATRGGGVALTGVGVRPCARPDTCDELDEDATTNATSMSAETSTTANARRRRTRADTRRRAGRGARSSRGDHTLQLFDRSCTHAPRALRDGRDAGTCARSLPRHNHPTYASPRGLRVGETSQPCGGGVVWGRLSLWRSEARRGLTLPRLPMSMFARGRRPTSVRSRRTIWIRSRSSNERRVGQTCSMRPQHKSRFLY